MTAPVDVAWLKELGKLGALPDPAPCPFCWSERVVYVHDGPTSVFIKCDECGASGPESESMSGAAREWNGIHAENGQLCEALECAVEAIVEANTTLKAGGGSAVAYDELERAHRRISALVRLKEEKTP